MSRRVERVSPVAYGSTGLPLSTYFSAIKLRWMIDHHKEVHDAHEKDDLMFGTVDTWLVYVSLRASFSKDRV